jgi:Lon protease-like protein
MSDPDPLDEFPHRFPIFPLPNVVLFPGTYLPLHIFEPRYRQMTGSRARGRRRDRHGACAPRRTR